MPPFRTRLRAFAKSATLGAGLAALWTATSTTDSVAQSIVVSHTLMPVPAVLKFGAGRFRIDTTLSVSLSRYSDERLVAGVQRALRRMAERTATPVVSAVQTGELARIVIAVEEAGEKSQSPAENEHYTLGVAANHVGIAAPTVVGALRGLETLLQLVSSDSIGFYLPAVAIDDQPRFPWRGLLIDACRHWEPVEVIERTLDGMAAVKLNVLHWHLSEDQGFRVESKRFPKLQQLGSDGLFYTQDEIRQVVAYARDRGIRVVPEFDMPGHATSWFVGYPEYASAPGPYAIERKFGVFDPAFDPTREEVYQFIDGFVAEMSPLFPDPYWHIGGDEVNGKQWNANPRIQRFMREHKLENNEALQAYFNRRLLKILESHGKRMIGWDEILHPDLPKTIMVQSWRGTEYLGQAAQAGFSGILSAPYYLDHIKSAEEHYLADPLPKEILLTQEERARVLGGEACMWGEHVSPETIDSRIWPRMAAIAERFWSPAEVRDVADMYRRLEVVSLELERLGLTHEAHSYRMIREIANRRGAQPLHDLLAWTQPVTFRQRHTNQATNQLTPLTRLVDAARPDPWGRFQLNQLAQQALQSPAGPEADSLRKTFAGWRLLPKAYASLTDMPLVRDGDSAVATLARLGAAGERALDFLRSGRRSNGWRDSTMAFLDGAAQPQGLLRVVGVEAVALLLGGVK